MDGSRAIVNGRTYELPEAATYLVHEADGRIERLEPGAADPVVLL